MEPLIEHVYDSLIEQLDASDTGGQVLATTGGTRIVISGEVVELPSDAVLDNPKEDWVRALRQAKWERHNDEQFHEISNKILSPITTATCDYIINDYADKKHGSLPCGLYEFLYPPIHFFKVVLGHDRGLSLEPIEESQAYAKVTVKEAHPGAHDLSFSIDPDLEEYSLDDVVVIESLRSSKASGHIACHVTVNGRDMFCKAERGGIAFGDSGVGYDFKRMLNIRTGLTRYPGVSPRVPKLLGYLRHPEEGHVVGFLREWVPGWNLASRSIEGIPNDALLTWDNKIAETVSMLHNIGAIWGGGDPDSVIIDNCGEPWLIDFSSGVASGFREEDCEDAEGDWRGVDRIAKYMGLCDGEDDNGCEYTMGGM